MCNEYRNRKTVRRLIDQCDDIEVPLGFPDGIPNIEPLDSIKITARAPVIVPDNRDGARLQMMRWSWPSPKGAPVFNFRSDNRRFEVKQRCLIPADGFYEFSASKDAKNAKAKRKDKWLFTLKGLDLFAIAGIWRSGAAQGQDAWTMLTCAPGPDIAPYHDRQVVVLPPERWKDWLTTEGNEGEILAPSSSGTVEAVRV